jgi:hypothetical protein
MGQRWAPGANWDTSAPCSAMRAARRRFSGGYTTSTPEPSTAMVRPPASSAPRCAALSIPRASPLTTVMPARGEIPRQPLRQLEAERCGAARPHDGDRERVLIHQAPAHPQAVRRGGYLAKMGGIFSIPAVDLPDRRRARR